MTGAKKTGSVTTERLAEVLCCHTMDRLLMIECLLWAPFSPARVDLLHPDLRFCIVAALKIVGKLLQAALVASCQMPDPARIFNRGLAAMHSILQFWPQASQMDAFHPLATGRTFNCAKRRDTRRDLSKSPWPSRLSRGLNHHASFSGVKSSFFSQKLIWHPRVTWPLITLPCHLNRDVLCSTLDCYMPPVPRL